MKKAFVPVVVLALMAFGTAAVFAKVPTKPRFPGATNTTTNSIQWTWEHSGQGDGFYAYTNEGSGPPITAVSTMISPSVHYYDNTRLSANTQYCFQVCSWLSDGNKYSEKTSNITRYTAALTPVFASSSDGAVHCNMGDTGGTFLSGTTFEFSAVNGFGTGQDKASSYLYYWGSSSPTEWDRWSSGTLSFTPESPGSYSLYLKALNGDCLATDYATSAEYSISAVPEPGTMASIICLLMPAGAIMLKKRRSAARNS